MKVEWDFVMSECLLERTAKLTARWSSFPTRLTEIERTRSNKHSPPKSKFNYKIQVGLGLGALRAKLYSHSSAHFIHILLINQNAMHINFVWAQQKSSQRIWWRKMFQSVEDSFGGLFCCQVQKQFASLLSFLVFKRIITRHFMQFD